VACEPGIAFVALVEGRCKFALGRINDPVEWFCGETAPVGKVCECCQVKAYIRLDRRRWAASHGAI
jgi:hypothetical protein